MCSFIITNDKLDNLEYVNFYSKLRGPDCTNKLVKNDITFVHNLLSITGEITVQPFIDDNIVCVYNGEIYNAFNFGDYKSDGECLIPLYKKYGPNFTKHLDGEFAIALFDFNKNIIIISSDIFATKPIWIAKDNGKFCISSYKSNADRIGITKTQKRLPANTTFVLNMNMEQIDAFNIYEFDLTQHKNTFDDWNKAFANSINKRCVQHVREKSFIGLSSGYDSGTISCEMIRQNIPHKAYTIKGVENQQVLKDRFDVLMKNKCDHQILDSSNRTEAHNYINKFVEEYYYEICTSRSDYNEFSTRLQDDLGAIGISMICTAAKKDNRKIYISGQGADEIISDYGFQGRSIFYHSNFGGLFPNDLKTIFPWKSFYGSSQRSYLTKEEYVSGSYGIEGRYPFLDKDVVQEYLWLSTDLKNNTYKSTLHKLMESQKYPFSAGAKIGFGI